jgi:hypothetical protein
MFAAHVVGLEPGLTATAATLKTSALESVSIVAEQGREFWGATALSKIAPI